MRITLSKGMRDWLEDGWDFIAGFGLAFIIYQSMGFALSTTMPLTAVVSYSMLPVYEKGDMLLLYGGGDYGLGDVVVYINPETQLPIVHRVVKITDDSRYVTKGDNNPDNDVNLGIVREPVPKSAVQGKVLLRFPFLGWVKILFLRYVGGMPI